jgi:hypothetical protein
MAVADTPLVGVEFFRRIIGGLECVGLGDWIVDAVIVAVALSFASNVLFLHRLFIGGEWEVSLAWDDG